MSLHIVFFGTPAFAVPSLRALLDGPDVVAGVVCQPDKPVGRGQQLAAPPVKELAVQRNVPVLQPTKLREPTVLDQLRALAPELIVVAAYGRILPPNILTLPRLGCINVHASLLPKYRGAAPIQWAILRGEKVTGITIMQMDEGMDTGEILLQREAPIGDDETYGNLQTRLAHLGAATLLQAIALLQRGELLPRSQDHAAATLAPLIAKEDGQLDWAKPATELARAVRAFNPWPSAYTTFRGELLKVHRAHAVTNHSGGPGTVDVRENRIIVACGVGALELDELQAAGRKRLPAGEFLRGVRLRSGERLGA